jgi:secondary thiamine-phosphate synthase enzyme
MGSGGGANGPGSSPPRGRAFGRSPACHHVPVLSEAFDIDTHGRRVVDVTDRLTAFAGSAGGDGLLHVFLPHATAGLALMETGSGSEEDLAEALERWLPRDDRYRHRHGSTGHGADHLMPSFVSPSLVLAVEGGRVVLGTWQRVVVVDPNRENDRRTVQLRFVAG